MVASTPRPRHFWIISLGVTSKYFANSSPLAYSGTAITFFDDTSSAVSAISLPFLYVFFFVFVSILANVWRTRSSTLFSSTPALLSVAGGLVLLMPFPISDSISVKFIFLSFTFFGAA